MRTRRASAIASIAASTSERDTLRAVSSTLTWSAATAVSKSLWSSEKSGAAFEVLLAARSAETRRRYSSRAEAWSSGKPSKPSAWAKRTTVELDVFARRASSSAVWKAASSRWSTMYWPTSFCERENSSKRWRISAERLRAWVVVRGTAECFARRPRVPSGRPATVVYRPAGRRSAPQSALPLREPDGTRALRRPAPRRNRPPRGRDRRARHDEHRRPAPPTRDGVRAPRARGDRPVGRHAPRLVGPGRAVVGPPACARARRRARPGGHLAGDPPHAPDPRRRRAVRDRAHARGGPRRAQLTEAEDDLRPRRGSPRRRP